VDTQACGHPEEVRPPERQPAPRAADWPAAPAQREALVDAIISQVFVSSSRLALESLVRLQCPDVGVEDLERRRALLGPQLELLAAEVAELDGRIERERCSRPPDDLSHSRIAADRQAAEIVADAQHRADQIVAEAERRAAEVEREAEERRSAVLAELEKLEHHLREWDERIGRLIHRRSAGRTPAPAQADPSNPQPADRPQAADAAPAGVGRQNGASGPAPSATEAGATESAQATGGAHDRAAGPAGEAADLVPTTSTVIFHTVPGFQPALAVERGIKGLPGVHDVRVAEFDERRLTFKVSHELGQTLTDAVLALDGVQLDLIDTAPERLQFQFKR
jgi:hypothetical protein